MGEQWTFNMKGRNYRKWEFTLCCQSVISSVKKSRVKGVINLNSDGSGSLNSASWCTDAFVMGVVEMCN